MSSQLLRCMACEQEAHDQCGEVHLVPLVNPERELWCECPCGTGEITDPLTPNGLIWLDCLLRHARRR